MSGMNVKLAGAIIGGGAVAAAVAFGVSESPPASEVDTATSTVHSSTKPPSTPTVSMAVPGIKGPAPLYPGQNPGDH
jgi:hypothetical protein